MRKISTYTLLKNQLQELVNRETDLELLKRNVKADKQYIEDCITIHEENGEEETVEKYYNELDILMYPIRTLEKEIRMIKRSIIEDYAELILTTTGDISLVNSILKTKKNAVKTDELMGALTRKFMLQA